MKPKLYWHGNIAKTKIIDEILGQVSIGKSISILDYGCGVGGDWPQILKDYPQIQLWGVEPHRESYLQAKSRLAGFNARVLTLSELEQENFQADFVVSFSVLEHVFDQKKYFCDVKNHLSPQGVCV